MIIPYENREEWYFKQFISQYDLDKFASDYGMIIKMKEKPHDHDN